MFSSLDCEYMTRALVLARRGQYTTAPNPNVGCVIVNNGTIVGEGFHARAGEPHAEVYALRMAGELARGSTVYVTLEPCSHFGRTPPCAQALLDAGVSKVIAAMQDPNPLVSGKGLAMLSAQGVETAFGCLEQDARALNPGFIQRMTCKRPLVRVKMAASLDARTAMANGESQWITGEAARADVHRLRAQSSAIMTGIGTILADDPSLTVRTIPDDYIGAVRQPIRIICDSQLRMPEHANILQQPGETWVMTCRAGAKVHALEALGAKVLVFEGVKGRLSMPQVLSRLAELDVNDVMVEAGAILSGHLLQMGLVDELWLYLAPHFMGDAAKGLFHLPGINQMSDRLNVNIAQVRSIGQDIRIKATFTKE